MKLWDSLKELGNDPTMGEKVNTGQETPGNNKDTVSKYFNDQIKAYRAKTELEANKKYAEETEKRRVQQKQIRALRNNYRPRSLMAVEPNEGMTDKLGG